MELTNEEKIAHINSLSDKELMDLMDSIGVGYDFTNGVLIDKERIIQRLTGQYQRQSNVTITYTYSGERIETKVKAPKIVATQYFNQQTRCYETRYTKVEDANA